MNVQEINKRKKEIKAHVEAGYVEKAVESCIELIEGLFQEKKHNKVVEIFRSNLIQQKKELFVFEVAYSLVDNGYKNEAEEIYEYLLNTEPKNSSVLNNLSNIKKKRVLLNKHLI